MSIPRSSQLLISSQQPLTTMDTNTNVTNSPLASVNPTAVPCGQCLIATTSAQSVLPAQQNIQTGHKPQLSHSCITGLQKSMHTVVHAAAVPAVMETYVHGNRGLIAHYPLGANALHEIQTLPRVIEQINTSTCTASQQSQFGTNYRPILIANAPTNINSLKGHNTPGSNNSLPSNQTYQMIAYPRQALNILQTHGKNLYALSTSTINTTTTTTTTATNNSGSNNNSLMLASVITPESLTNDSSNSAARIAQLLTPSGTHSTTAAATHIGGNAQFLVYYPQQLNTGVKVHSVGTSPQTLATTVSTTSTSTSQINATQLPSTINVATGSIGGVNSSSGVNYTPIIPSNHMTMNPSKLILSTSSQNEDSTTGNPSHQPYTVYYALPTSDLLRQLKLNHHQAIQIDPNISSRQQIIQTPSGLMLIQYPQQQQQHQHHHQQQCPTGNSSPTLINTGSQQQSHQHIQNDNTLPRNLITSGTLTKHNIQQIGVVNTGIPVTISVAGTHTDSHTLTRHTRVEHVQGSGLICTCPPEVHQAIFEQQKKRQQAQPATVILTGISPLNKINTTAPTTITTINTTTNNSTIFEASEITCNSSNVTVVNENGLLTRNCTEKLSEEELNNQKRNFQSCHLTNCGSATTDTLKKTIQSQTVNNTANHHQLLDETTEKEAHVNYLVTLFQALKSSGVQADSFKEAFERIGLPVTNSKLSTNLVDLHNKKQTLLKTKLYQIEEMRKSVKSCYQLFNEFNRKFTLDLNNCNKILMKLSNQKTATHHTVLDPQLEVIYNERRSLDRSLHEMYEINAVLSEQLYDLECVIEQTGNDVLQHRCRITLPYVQILENRLDSINSTVSIACGHYPEIQQVLNNREEIEMKAIEIQKRVLNDHLYQLKDVNEKCKRIKGTILTLKRLAIVNVQNRQRSNSPRRFTHLGGFVNRAAADRGSIERCRLYAAVQNIQPDSEKRLQAIKKQEMLAIQKRRVFSTEATVPNVSLLTTIEVQKSLQNKSMTTPVTDSDKSSLPPKELKSPTVIVTTSLSIDNKDEKRAPLAAYSDDSISSVNTSTTDSSNNEMTKIHQLPKGFNPDTITSMMDESSDSTLESVQPVIIPTSILKGSTSNPLPNSNSPKQRNRLGNRGSRGVMFNTTVTVDDGSEVVRLNCTLDDSELSKNKVPPTDRSNSSPLSRIGGISDRFSRSKSPHERVSKITTTSKSGSSTTTVKNSSTSNNNSEAKGETKPDTMLSSLDFSQTSEFGYTVPTPPPRRSSQVTTTNIDGDNTMKSATYSNKQDGETVSSLSNKRLLPLPTNAESNENVISPCE
ncbi:Coiled-coil domain-containing protein [Schistosoma japonicum]|nr:Coiled-coil domain-containing protein [Schistosoma japonicum]